MAGCGINATQAQNASLACVLFAAQPKFFLDVEKPFSKVHVYALSVRGRMCCRVTIGFPFASYQQQMRACTCLG